MDTDPNGFLDGLRRAMSDLAARRGDPGPACGVSWVTENPDRCARLPLALRLNCVRHLRPAHDLSCSASSDDSDRRALARLADEARRVASEVMRQAKDGLGHGHARPDRPHHGGPATLH